jgi:hypothetical protein
VRVAFAVLLTLHGIAHLVGFLVAWGLLTSAEVPRRTTLFGSALDLGEAGLRVYGTGWLVLALGFVAAGVACLLGLPWWPTCSLAASGVSLAYGVASLPESRIGLAVNVVVIAWAWLGLARGWFAGSGG